MGQTSYARVKKWRQENPEKNREIARSYRKNMSQKQKDAEHLYHKTYKENFRNEVIEHYGGRCVCCGETRREFLAFDHTNEDGAEERKRLGIKSGWATVRYLNKYHPGNIQILCHNCNSARGFYGYCPHQKEEPMFFEHDTFVGVRFY